MQLQWLGFKPVFCDIDPRMHTIDPVRVEELITRKRRASLVFTFWTALRHPCIGGNCTAAWFETVI